MLLFFVDLAPSTNNKDILKIKFLHSMEVMIEIPHCRYDIPQCAKCQRYGRTKCYCSLMPRCVKCGKNHLTAVCTEEKSTEANYKSYTVDREIQSRKFLKLMEKKLLPPTIVPSKPTEFPRIKPGLS